MKWKYTFELCVLNTKTGMWEPRVIQNANIVPRKGDGILLGDSSYTVRNVVYDLNQIVGDSHVVKLYIVSGI